METKKIFSLIGLCYTLYLAVETMLCFLCLKVIVYKDMVLSENAETVLGLVIMYGVAFPMFYYFIKKVPKTSLIRREQMDASELTMWILFCFGLAYLGNFASQILMFLVEISTGLSMVNPVETMVFEINLPILFVATVILAPFVEEMMFRKLLLDRIGFLGELPAIIFSGFIFGVFHGNLYQFLYAFLLGSTFAFIYCKTGKIRYTIFIHMIVNFMGGIFPAILLQSFEHNPMLGMIGMTFQVIFMLLMFVCSIVVLFAFVRHQVFFTSKEQVSLVDALLTPGMLVCFVVQILCICFW